MNKKNQTYFKNVFSEDFKETRSPTPKLAKDYYSALVKKITILSFEKKFAYIHLFPKNISLKNKKLIIQKIAIKFPQFYFEFGDCQQKSLVVHKTSMICSYCQCVYLNSLQAYVLAGAPPGSNKLCFFAAIKEKLIAQIFAKDCSKKLVKVNLDEWGKNCFKFAYTVGVGQSNVFFELNQLFLDEFMQARTKVLVKNFFLSELS